MLHDHEQLSNSKLMECLIECNLGAGILILVSIYISHVMQIVVRPRLAKMNQSCSNLLL